jgi:flagellum-specific peptidoglycan hydrolase FlgJ
MTRPPHVASFLEAVSPTVLRLCPANLFPSVVLAQAALESGWNPSAKTLFGIKGRGTAGSVNIGTHEELADGSKEHIHDDFAAYNALDEAVQGYIDLIMGQGQYAKVTRYAPARVCSTPEQMIRAIVDAGYCTASSYVPDILAIITCFNLTQFDKGHGK